MKYLKRFESIKSNEIKIKSRMSMGMDSIDIDFEIYIGVEYIGMCELEVLPKKEEFDDRNDSIRYGKDIEFDYLNTPKKADILKYKHILIISGFEIESEYQNRGFGTKSMSQILRYALDKFPKNSGIYLFVYKDNLSAVKIYKKIGFELIKVEDTVLTMAYKNKLVNEIY